jgi:peptidoglycan-associated lipoprotein
VNKKLLAIMAGGTVLLFLFAGCASKKPGVGDDQGDIAVADTIPPPPPPPPPLVEEPPPPPVELVFEIVYFDFDKYTLKSDAKSALGTNARTLRENDDASILIQGHCDERGTVEYNLALGEKRAKACRDYLVDLGITAGRIRTISYGEERPVSPGHDETAWSRNRRAEFVRTDQ